MPKSDKLKISDEDVQAYLLGEGSADVYDKIQNVDDAAVSSLDADDLKIKETLEAFRKVDQLFNEAIDQSIGIFINSSELFIQNFDIPKFSDPTIIADDEL